MLRYVLVASSFLIAVPAFGGEMNATEARRFVVGKMFSFNCFEGTKGTGRIRADGSVAGTVQFGGNNQVRYVSLPANTLRVKGESVCASIKGMPFEPCFNLQKMDEASFRGSLSGLGFAYCDFTRRPARLEYVSNEAPLSLRSTIAASDRN